MPSHADRRILITLAMTLALGVPLCLLAREAFLTLFGEKTVQSFWADDFHDPYGIGRQEGTALADAGIALSQIQPLSMNAHSLAAGPDGSIYGGGYQSLWAYNPAQGIVEKLPLPFLAADYISGLTVAPDSRLYGVAMIVDNQYNLHRRLFVYNPRTQAMRNLGVISQTQALIVGPDGRIYGFAERPQPSFVYDPATSVIAPLKSPMQLFASVHIPPVLGDDDLIYGAASQTNANNLSYIVFALDLTSGAIITHELPADARALTPRPGGGVYVALEAGRGLWVFDPANGGLAALPLPPSVKPFAIYAMTARSDGRLYVAGDYFLFVYTPWSGTFERLEATNELQWYWRTMITGPDDRIYVVKNYGLVMLETGVYTTQGTAQSEVIRPASLALTNTVVGGYNASVAALACGRDGRVYGVKSALANGEWLFWYDPQAPESEVGYAAPRVSSEQQGSFLGGTALVALDDGRLVGGTNSGHLFVYTPATGETWDVGKPVSDTQQIAALTMGHDGVIYGGTSSYNRATLFAFDPASGVITDVGTPLPNAHVVGALTVAQDGRILAGVGPKLMSYDPATRSSIVEATADISSSPCFIHALVAGPDGRIYGGCGDRVFAYDPAGSGSLTHLDTAGRSYGVVSSLVAVDDGRVYGVIDGPYAMGEIFAYDTIRERMTHLGIAVPRGVTALAACDKGTIYGGSGIAETFAVDGGQAYLFSFRTDCPSGLIGAWDKVTWEADTPPGTRVVVDVLDASGKLLVGNVQSGDSLRALDAADNPALILQAQLYTGDARVTPVLKRWRVDYTFECGRGGTLREGNPQPAPPIDPLDWFRRLFQP